MSLNIIRFFHASFLHYSHIVFYSIFDFHDIQCFLMFFFLFCAQIVFYERGMYSPEEEHIKNTLL